MKINYMAYTQMMFSKGLLVGLLLFISCNNTDGAKPWEGKWRGDLDRRALSELRFHLPLRDSVVYLACGRAEFSRDELRALGSENIFLCTGWTKEQFFSNRKDGVQVWFEQKPNSNGARVHFAKVQDQEVVFYGHSSYFYSDYDRFWRSDFEENEDGTAVPPKSTNEDPTSVSGGALAEASLVSIGQGLSCVDWPLFLSGNQVSFSTTELEKLNCSNYTILLGRDKNEFLEARESGLWLWLDRTGSENRVAVDFVFININVPTRFGKGELIDGQFTITEESGLDY
ncbi:MAG: hypothetical protein HQ519_00830 [Planctomycetes bacterium]|nr:hypothetical protein [Planctomycetota bacterium]